MTIKAKKSKINLREKLAELLNFRQIRDRLDGLGLYLGKDRTGTTENVAVRGGANVDDLQLAEISTAVGGTAVDVFVYDTRNDSDGGKWRERTQNTSWYNEELNTATRGGRREFPAVAVIIAEADKVTIYDGDDPDLNMWMVFEGTYLGVDIVNILTSDDTHPLSSVFALQGILCIGVSALNGFEYINFVDDSAGYYRASISGIYNGGILERNDGKGKTLNSGSFLVDDTVNDVAMTVLPNAPVDDNTGLPIPTIAVATDGGVSVIKDDGNVVDKATTSAAVNQVQWMGSGRLVASAPTYYGVFDDPFTQESDDFVGYISDSVYNANPDNNHLYQVPNIITQLDDNSKLLTLDTRTIIASTSAGLNVHEMSEGAAADNNHGIATYITSEYNTGWMPGDIKLAALSDTKVEKVGVDESTDLVTNNEFATDSDWTKEAGWSISGGTAVASNGATIYQIVDDLTIGRTYKISINVLTVTSGSVSYRASSTGQGGSLDIYRWDSVTGIREIVFKADTTSMLIGVYGNTFSGTIGSVSLKQTGELITNGTFDNGTTGWDKGTDSTFDPLTGQAVVGGTYAGGGYIRQNVMDLIEGKTYTVSAEVVSFTGDFAKFYVGPTSNGVTTETTGYHSFTFVYSSSIGNFLYLQAAPSNETATFDNISIRLAEDDRSVSDNRLQIFGEIDKTPVAPGADLVAYSGFSANNYLMQPYNSDLDFSTGDFSIMGWVKLNSAPYGTSIGCIAAISDTSLKFYLNVTHDTGSFGLFLNDSTQITSESTAKAGSWAFVVAKRTSGELSISVNGKKNANDVTYINAINITSPPITSIGFRLTDGDAELNGSLALLRISKTAPTDAQIAKIYLDEKVLFQDGAQATLYGASNAVTALAYDDKTELLHVGTASGRSDFAGLRRINNTTIPVTTSISASNNLIAEQ